MTALTDLLILASESEGVPPDHIAAKLAVPIAVVIFCGAVYALLWANYGAKKGALIYATALFGFTMMLGVFWWFGAPGTPVATGLQNFPGQAPDAYQGAWYPFEPGSPRAQFFPATNDLDSFQTVEEYVGTDDPRSPEYAFISGDLDQATGRMLEQWLPTDEQGGLRIGAGRRAELIEQAGPVPDGLVRADPFYTAEVDEVLVADDGGIRVAGARMVTFANYADPESDLVVEQEPVEEGIWFAFKDPGALWFPSAVWTFVSLALFVLSLFALDRMEQREKRRRAEVEEAEDLAVPIAQ